MSLNENKDKKPHSSTINKWGLKFQYHTFPPIKTIGEQISEGMIADWEKMSIKIFLREG
jgi:hypothetical protein